jgi:hypothetical protein
MKRKRGEEKKLARDLLSKLQSANGAKFPDADLRYDVVIKLRAVTLQRNAADCWEATFPERFPALFVADNVEPARLGHYIEIARKRMEAIRADEWSKNCAVPYLAIAPARPIWSPAAHLTVRPARKRARKEKET